ncbi:hypothetical protein Tco_1447905 [Tanacetum coccineum]
MHSMSVKHTQRGTSFFTPSGTLKPIAIELSLPWRSQQKYVLTPLRVWQFQTRVKDMLLAACRKECKSTATRLSKRDQWIDNLLLTASQKAVGPQRMFQISGPLGCRIQQTNVDLVMQSWLNRRSPLMLVFMVAITPVDAPFDAPAYPPAVHGGCHKLIVSCAVSHVMKPPSSSLLLPVLTSLLLFFI